MKAHLVIDIETRGDPRLDTPKYWQRVMDEIPDNKSIKDPLKQQAWKGQKLEDHKTSMALRATTGRVAAIGLAEIHDPYAAEVLCDVDDEGALLKEFGDALVERYPGRRVVCGFYCRDFDIPFLTARCGIHGVSLPRWWPFMRDWKGVADLTDIFGRNGKLDDWLLAFGMEGKPCTGAESLLLDPEELADYCLQDVRSMAQLFERVWERFPSLWSKKDRTA